MRGVSAHLWWHALGVTATRLIELLGLLQRGPRVKAAELAGRLGVHERTVRRDVERLEAAGVVIYRSRGRHGGYWMGAARELEADGRLGPFLLSGDEAVAVVTGLRAIRPRNRSGGAPSDEERAATRRFQGWAGRSEADVFGDARRVLGRVWRVMPAGERQRVRRLEVAIAWAGDRVGPIAPAADFSSIRTSDAS
jgi:predicted DNA-binding transcriptional regulator YafY